MSTFFQYLSHKKQFLITCTSVVCPSKWTFSFVSPVFDNSHSMKVLLPSICITLLPGRSSPYCTISLLKYWTLFWNIMLCHWVRGSQHIEGMHWRHLQVIREVPEEIPLGPLNPWRLQPQLWMVLVSLSYGFSQNFLQTFFRYVLVISDIIRIPALLSTLAVSSDQQ